MGKKGRDEVLNYKFPTKICSFAPNFVYSEDTQKINNKSESRYLNQNWSVFFSIESSIIFLQFLGYGFILWIFLDKNCRYYLDIMIIFLLIIIPYIMIRINNEGLTKLFHRVLNFDQWIIICAVPETKENLLSNCIRGHSAFSVAAVLLHIILQFLKYLSRSCLEMVTTIELQDFERVFLKIIRFLSSHFS